MKTDVSGGRLTRLPRQDRTRRDAVSCSDAQQGGNLPLRHLFAAGEEKKRTFCPKDRNFYGTHRQSRLNPQRQTGSIVEKRTLCPEKRIFYNIALRVKNELTAANRIHGGKPAILSVFTVIFTSLRQPCPGRTHSGKGKVPPESGKPRFRTRWR